MSKLELVVEGNSIALDVPEDIVESAEEFFQSLDADLDQGWQMGRAWVEDPDAQQRCQIVAERLVKALNSENVKLSVLLAGYIARTLPELTRIEVDMTGELQDSPMETEPSPQLAPPPSLPGGPLDKLSAMQQAEQEISKPYKVGRAWRFSVFNHQSGQWQQGPSVKSEAEAEALRSEAYRQRFTQLTGADDDAT